MSQAYVPDLREISARQALNFASEVHPAKVLRVLLTAFWTCLVRSGPHTPLVGGLVVGAGAGDEEGGGEGAGFGESRSARCRTGPVAPATARACPPRETASATRSASNSAAPVG